MWIVIIGELWKQRNRIESKNGRVDHAFRDFHVGATKGYLMNYMQGAVDFFFIDNKRIYNRGISKILQPLYTTIRQINPLTLLISTIIPTSPLTFIFSYRPHIDQKFKTLI